LLSPNQNQTQSKEIDQNKLNQLHPNQTNKQYSTNPNKMKTNQTKPKPIKVHQNQPI